jgi:predicted alpha/beta hydrolase
MPGKYPVLMIPGLMQSSGAFCVNDDDSLAFFLCKSGYDVWLGNNRGYFHPEHRTLKPSSSEFWAWNLRHLANLDIPALVNFVHTQTARPKVPPNRPFPRF